MGAPNIPGLVKQRDFEAMILKKRLKEGYKPKLFMSLGECADLAYFKNSKTVYEITKNGSWIRRLDLEEKFKNE